MKVLFISGRLHSVDVPADFTFDAAHLFVVEAKKERAVGLPKPTLATMLACRTAAIKESRPLLTFFVCHMIFSRRQPPWPDI